MRHIKSVSREIMHFVSMLVTSLAVRLSKFIFSLRSPAFKCMRCVTSTSTNASAAAMKPSQHATVEHLCKCCKIIFLTISIVCNVVSVVSSEQSPVLGINFTLSTLRLSSMLNRRTHATGAYSDDFDVVCSACCECGLRGLFPAILLRDKLPGTNFFSAITCNMKTNLEGTKIQKFHHFQSAVMMSLQRCRPATYDPYTFLSLLVLHVYFDYQ